MIHKSREKCVVTLGFNRKINEKVFCGRSSKRKKSVLNKYNHRPSFLLGPWAKREEIDKSMIFGQLLEREVKKYEKKGERRGQKPLRKRPSLGRNSWDKEEKKKIHPTSGNSSSEKKIPEGGSRSRRKKQCSDYRYRGGIREGGGEGVWKGFSWKEVVQKQTKVAF